MMRTAASPSLGQHFSVDDALASFRLAFLGLGAISLIINLLMLTGPIFMLQVYDRVLTSRSMPTLIALAGLAVGLYLFFGLLEALRGRAMIRIGQLLEVRLSGVTFAAAVSLPVVVGANNRKMDPIRDLDQLRQFLSSPGPTAIFDLPWMPAYLAVVFLLHPTLGQLAVVGAVVICILMMLNEVTGRVPTRQAAEYAAGRARQASTARQNAEAIAAMGMLGALQQRWRTTNDRYQASLGASADRSSLFTTLIKVLRFMLQSAVLGVGAWLVLRQEITAGVMIAASIITSRALAPVELAVAHWRGFLASRQGVRRLREVLAATALRNPETELPLPSRTLVVDGLATGPIGTRTMLVQGADFRLEAGDALGIIGPSGAGKTSLVRAILGVWPALRGSIRFDGAERFQWSLERVGQIVGYLPQTVELFDGTVAENIARFDPEWKSEEVLKAARMTGIEDLVKSLPSGYDTQIGAGGVSLSAGQRQRIGLARALYGAPFLIVLDEPNSNLDTDGEEALKQAILTMREANKIVIVIAHRPSAIAAVNFLIYLKDGKAQMFGPKDEVLQKVTSAPQVNAVTTFGAPGNV